MLVVHLLNLLIHFMLYLRLWLYAFISLWSLVRISSSSASFGILIVYNCLNTCLYTF
jgi:hypothetical protein